MHLDDEALALLALGDLELDSQQSAHLAECAQCSRELAELARTVDYGRSSDDVELLQPPARVWAEIHSQLGLTSSALPALVEPPEPEAAPPRSITPRSWWALTAAALVVGLLVGIAASAWWPRPSSTVVAEATLAPLPDWDASGTAKLEQGSSEDSRALVVSLDAATASDLREVWLIAPETNGLISLGQLVGESGRFTVPPDVDLRLYSLVDISDEPTDGNPAHSGNSIVRGELHQT